MQYTKPYSIIVNLAYAPLLSRYIPTPYIVGQEKDGTLGSVKARATEDTRGDYNITADPDKLTKLIKLCNDLTIDTLQKKYCTKKRTENTLEKRLSEPIIKKSILGYYDRVFIKMLELVSSSHIPMIFDIVRKTRLESLKIHTTIPTPLQPNLIFDKIQLGIKYILELKSDQSSLLPVNHDIHILTDQDAYIVLDYQLYNIAHINGNKLKPFLKKEHIFIKNDMSVTYFQKFILDVARQVNIEARGFDVIKNSNILGHTLLPVHDYLQDRLDAEVKFRYQGASFLHNSKAQKKTSLDIKDDSEISIHQVVRDLEAEQEIMNTLATLGFEQDGNGKIKCPSSDKYGIVDHIARNQDQLQRLGFEIGSPRIGNRQIAMSTAQITISQTYDNDWFDLKATVIVGDNEIQFSQLLNHIKNEDPFFPLEDGSFFCIPQAWMTKYKDLSLIARSDDNQVRLRKSQYTALEGLDILATGIEGWSPAEQVDNSPSANLKAELRPYQRQGVEWLIDHQNKGLGACLADDMGLGKTLQTIAVLTHTKDQLKTQSAAVSGQMTLFASQMQDSIRPLKALIILPSSLVFNWVSELQKFNPSLHVLQYIGTKRKTKRESLDKFDIVLTTYQTALRDVTLLSDIHWEYIILDESQMIKNKSSKVFQAINKLDAHHRISLSGTPIENSLSDLWSQMQFINPDMLGSYEFFKKSFQLPIEKHQNEDAMKALANLVQPYILRRTKEQVAKDLPILSETIDYISLGTDHTEFYDKIKSATRNQILGAEDLTSSKMHLFAALTKLRQIATTPRLVDSEYQGNSNKVDHILSRMDQVIRSGHKLLIFSSFTKILDLFKEHAADRAWSYASLTGSDSQQQRQRSVETFQQDVDTPIFFISLKAGGTGLNLTAADYVFILDPWWNPFAEKQAIARAHRIGQTNPVTVVRFIAKNTLEEKIIQLQKRKKELSDSIMHFDEHKLPLDREDIAYILD